MVQVQMATAPTAQQREARQPTARPMPALNTSEVDPVVGHSIDQVREEIDEMVKDIRSFYNREPDDVFRLIAGHSARLSELRLRISRIENLKRQWQMVRTREVELIMAELTTQFQMASRRLSSRELNYKMETGR